MAVIRDYPENETVLVNLTGEAHEDDVLSYSVGMSVIPVPVPK